MEMNPHGEMKMLSQSLIYRAMLVCMAVITLGAGCAANKSSVKTYELRSEREVSPDGETRTRYEHASTKRGTPRKCEDVDQSAHFTMIPIVEAQPAQQPEQMQVIPIVEAQPIQMTPPPAPPVQEQVITVYTTPDAHDDEEAVADLRERNAQAKEQVTRSKIGIEYAEHARDRQQEAYTLAIEAHGAREAVNKAMLGPIDELPPSLKKQEPAPAPAPAPVAPVVPPSVTRGSSYQHLDIKYTREAIRSSLPPVPVGQNRIATWQLNLDGYVPDAADGDAEWMFEMAVGFYAKAVYTSFTPEDRAKLFDQQGRLCVVAAIEFVLNMTKSTKDPNGIHPRVYYNRQLWATR